MPLPVHHHICGKLPHHPPDLLVLFSRIHLLRSPPLSPHRRLPSLPQFYRTSSPKSPSRVFSASAASLEDDLRSTTTVPSSSSSSTFYAGEGVSWKSLGVSDELSAALSNVSLQRPSLVQAACIPQIFSGKDVVIAAETGSGKTHGYLVPLIDGLYNSLEHCRNDDDSQNFTKHRRASLILCPNVMLCEQVVKMINSLCKKCGEPLFKVSPVCGQHGWPVERPDIIVSTPVALLNCLYALGAGRQRRPEFVRDVKYVVFDEADMLLCGSFQNQIIRLINLFRFEEKQQSKMESELSLPSMVENVSSSFTVKDSPKPENNCAYSELQEGSRSLKLENESISSKSEDLIEMNLVLPNDNHSEIVTFSSEKDETDDDEVLDGSEIQKNKFRNKKKNDWRRVRKNYKRSKQYVFVAATLPGNGKKTAGGVLKHMFPDAEWVSGDYLHCHNPRLEQRWVEVTVDTQVDALINAVKSSFQSQSIDSSSGTDRAMVFANTVDAAQSVAGILQQVDIECLCYHSAISFEERMDTLSSFREKGGVLVCTDAAARGLDIPNISHVIQAEFATSAVEFLHRIGRTARAGQYGIVTSLYTESNRDLVSAVRQAEKLGQPLEQAFSRKRSFRNKLKKRGLNRLKDSPSHGPVPA